MAYSNSRPYVRAAVRSPAKRKKARPSDFVKYHFCFSAVDTSKSKNLYSIADELFGEYDFVTNFLKAGPEHYLTLSMDADQLIHIDFKGDEWTPFETDVVFDKIRSRLRANGIFFAFTNWKEEPEKAS